MTAVTFLGVGKMGTALAATALTAELVDAVQQLIHRQIDAGHGFDGFARIIESLRHRRVAA